MYHVIQMDYFFLDLIYLDLFLRIISINYFTNYHISLNHISRLDVFFMLTREGKDLNYFEEEAGKAE